VTSEVRERGFEAEEVVAILAQKFSAAGWSSRTDIVDATEFKLVAAVDRGTLTAVIKRLPDRTLGPTLRLPVSTVQTEFENVDQQHQQEVTELIERSLLRGGG